MKNILTISLFLLCVWSSYAEAKNKSKWYQVTADPYLTVRSQPSIRGKKIGKLPHNSLVKLIKYTKKKQNIGGRSAHWALVEFKKAKGYVFSAYLSRYTKKNNKKVKMVIVPDIEKDCDFDADKRLIALGLKVKRIDIHGPDDPDASGIGCPYRQSPKAGTKVKKGTLVTYRAWWENG